MVSEIAKLGMILGGAVLIIVGGLAIQLKIKKKKAAKEEAMLMGGSSSSQSNISLESSDPSVKQIIDYINQYKAQYSKDSIKQSLISAGHDSVKVEELLDKYF